MPFFGAPIPVRHQPVSTATSNDSHQLSQYDPAVSRLIEADMCAKRDQARLGAMLRYKDDASQDSLPPVKTKTFDLQTWKTQRALRAAEATGGDGASLGRGECAGESLAAAASLSLTVAPRQQTSIHDEDKTLGKLYYEPYVSQEDQLAAAASPPAVTHPKSSKRLRGAEVSLRPSSVGGSSSALSRPNSRGGQQLVTSRLGGFPSTSELSTADLLQLLTPEAREYYDGNYLLSTPSSILALMEGTMWQRPTPSKNHQLIKNLGPNTARNGDVRAALQLAGVKYVEQRYKPSRAVLYSDVPGTSTHFLPPAHIVDDVPTAPSSLSPNPNASLDGRGCDISSLSFSSSLVDVATATVQAPMLVGRVRASRDRVRAWRVNGGTIPNYGVDKPRAVQAQSVAESTVSLLTSHSKGSLQEMQLINKRLPPLGGECDDCTITTTTPLPALYNYDYRELYREADILSEEQDIRQELYDGKKRDFERRVQYVGSVMAGMAEGKFLQPYDRSLLEPTHDAIQVQLRQTLKREDMPVMFVRHEEDFPPGYFGEESSEEEESEED